MEKESISEEVKKEEKKKSKLSVPLIIFLILLCAGALLYLKINSLFNGMTPDQINELKDPKLILSLAFFLGLLLITGVWKFINRENKYEKYRFWIWTISSILVSILVDLALTSGKYAMPFGWSSYLFSFIGSATLVYLFVYPENAVHKLFYEVSKWTGGRMARVLDYVCIPLMILTIPFMGSIIGLYPTDPTVFSIGMHINFSDMITFLVRALEYPLLKLYSLGISSPILWLCLSVFGGLFTIYYAVVKVIEEDRENMSMEEFVGLCSEKDLDAEDIKDVEMLLQTPPKMRKEAYEEMVKKNQKVKGGNKK